MDDLPDELIDMICGHCEKPEIKALRLTCKTILKSANEHLFPEIVVFMNQDSLNACRQAVAHPVFSRTARNLWVQADRPKKLSFKEWDEQRIEDLGSDALHETLEELGNNYARGPGDEEYFAAMEKELADRQARAASNAPRVTRKQLRDQWHHAVRLAEEAESMPWDNSLYECYRQILLKCPKLDSVDFTMGHRARVGTTKYNKTFQKGLVHVFGDIDETISGVETLGELVQAAFEVGFRPKDIVFGDVSHLLFMQHEVFDEVLQFFSNVEQLVWEFSVPYLKDSDCSLDRRAFYQLLDDFDEYSNFVRLMEVTTNLKQLRLDLPEHHSGENTVKLCSVVGDITWEYLTHLDIANFETTPEKLSGLLLRHKDILEEVRLGEIHLQEGIWPECFAAFAGKLSNVQQFELRGEFGNTSIFQTSRFYWFGHLDQGKNNMYGEQVCKYLIAGGGVFPPKPEKQERDESMSGLNQNTRPENVVAPDERDETSESDEDFE